MKSLEQRLSRIQIALSSKGVIALSEAARNAGEVKYHIYRQFQRLSNKTWIVQAPAQLAYTRIIGLHVAEIQVQQRKTAPGTDG
ncbi:hypothetical protein D3C76_1499430 [compost metagenome]